MYFCGGGTVPNPEPCVREGASVESVPYGSRKEFCCFDSFSSVEYNIINGKIVSSYINLQGGIMTAEELRALKEQKGYSFAQISDFSGVSLGTVVKVLSGKSASPRQATLDALEKMLTDPQYEYMAKIFANDE
jgi:hypothetical protein